MCRKLLDDLISDSFVLSVGFLSTPGALRRFLSRTREVRDIRESLRQGAITEETIREFVSSLLVGFHAGQRFEHELALGALAVVLERRPTNFAEEFLLDLATLKLTEMPLCIRVARECLQHRVTIAQNKVKGFAPWPWPNELCSQEVSRDWLGSLDAIPTIGKLIDMRPTNAAA
jgi:hypothetical protein